MLYTVYLCVRITPLLRCARVRRTQSTGIYTFTCTRSECPNGVYNIIYNGLTIKNVYAPTAVYVILIWPSRFGLHL